MSARKTKTAPLPVTEERIRARAYEIFQARQGAPGEPLADWLQAERELKAAAIEIPAANVESKARARGERLLAQGN